MNDSIKKYIYILGTFFALFIVFKLFIKLLPWLLLFGGVLFIASKVKAFINHGKANEGNNSNYQHKDSSFENNYENSAQDYTTGEVIDVDYEDVDNK